jgi:hypothetical protein
MELENSRPATPKGFQLPPLVRRARFPFDGANRIRFEDFRDGSCPHLSPTPRVRLNKLSPQNVPARGGFNPIFYPAAQVAAFPE